MCSVGNYNVVDDLTTVKLVVIISKYNCHCPCSTGGALQITIDHLPSIGVDEYVHDASCDDNEDTCVDPDHDIPAEDNILKDKACIAYHMSLLQLAQHLDLPQKECKKCGTGIPFQVKMSHRGTAAIIEWVRFHFTAHNFTIDICTSLDTSFGSGQ